MSIVALIVPWSVCGGNHVSFMWTLFGVLSSSQTVIFYSVLQFTFVYGFLSALCFVCVTAGAVMFFKSLPKLGSALVLAGVLISIVNIAFLEAFPSGAITVLIIPVGMLVASINVIQGSRSAATQNMKFETKKIICIILVALVASAGAVALVESVQSVDAAPNPPQFCTHDFVQLSQFSEISVFRSFEGHDYSDGYEHNLSMKHYFTPATSATNIGVYSPVDGVVTAIFAEQNGVNDQVQIQVSKYADYKVVIFHVNVTSSLHVGEAVTAGQTLGTLNVNQGTDIAIWHMGIFRDRLYSYFAVMTDNVFANYQAHGISERSQMIRTASEAKELSVTYSFSNPDINDDWVTLN